MDDCHIKTISDLEYCTHLYMDTNVIHRVSNQYRVIIHFDNKTSISTELKSLSAGPNEYLAPRPGLQSDYGGRTVGGLLLAKRFATNKVVRLR